MRYIYIYIYTYMYVYVCIYIYIYTYMPSLWSLEDPEASGSTERQGWALGGRASSHGSATKWPGRDLKNSDSKSTTIPIPRPIFSALFFSKSTIDPYPGLLLSAFFFGVSALMSDLSLISGRMSYKCARPYLEGPRDWLGRVDSKRLVEEAGLCLANTCVVERGLGFRGLGV